MTTKIIEEAVIALLRLNNNQDRIRALYEAMSREEVAEGWRRAESAVDTQTTVIPFAPRKEEERQGRGYWLGRRDGCVWIPSDDNADPIPW